MLGEITKKLNKKNHYLKKKRSKEIGQIEIQKRIEKVNKTKSWFFENLNKIEKPLARLPKKGKELK